MPLHDLSLVTQVLVRLIRDRVAISPGWLPRPAPEVTPHPPDRLTGEAIGFYLYHVREDASRKNAPAPGPGHPPVRFTPMGLSLYYVLTAQSEGEGSERTYAEQRLMGCAMKVLHDFPILDDGTVATGPTPLFELFGIDGADNRIRIDLQPIPYEQAVSYWTASSSQPRLAAYYQVSVVLLEPDKVTSRTGRVLNYGIQTFVTGSPKVDATENVVTYDVPGDPVKRSLTLRPAQVPYGGEMAVVGADLSGDVSNVILRGGEWPKPMTVDAAWGVSARDTKLTMTIAESADGAEVLPGIYALTVETVRQRRMPDGALRDFRFRSSPTPFTITPSLELPGPLDALRVFRIRGYVFKHASITGDDLEIYLGPTKLVVGTLGALDPGEFAVVDARELEIRVPASAASGVHLLRVVVRGFEAPPRFVEVP